MKTIRAIVFDGTTDNLTLTDVKDDLDGFYDAIKCSTFEGYSSTELGQSYGYDLYLDGNGKIGEVKPMLTGLFVRRETMQIVDTLVGNLLICTHDDDGNSVSLGDVAPAIVARHVRKRSETNIPDIWRDRFGEFKASPYLLVLYC